MENRKKTRTVFLFLYDKSFWLSSVNSLSTQCIENRLLCHWFVVEPNWLNWFNVTIGEGNVVLSTGESSVYSDLYLKLWIIYLFFLKDLISDKQEGGGMKRNLRFYCDTPILVLSQKTPLVLFFNDVSVGWRQIINGFLLQSFPTPSP